MAPKFKFTEGERVLCFHGPLLYEAKCIKYEQKDKISRYFVHYQGWNKSWDEWVPENRVLKYNEANVQKQRELQKAQAAAKAKNRKARKLGEKEDEPSSPGTPEVPTKGAKIKSKELTIAEAESSKELPKDQASKDGGPPKKKVKIEPNVETEEEFVTKVEVKIKMPEELKSWLVDDWDLVSRQKKLLDLPVKINSVDQIIEQYLMQKKGSKVAVSEVLVGVKEYFNAMIGCQLLYKFERPQYEKILKTELDDGKTMSSIYGAVHLTRLFVKLGQMLVYTDLDEKDTSLLLVHLNDFLKFLSKSNMFSSSDYITATPEYHRKTL